MQLSARWRPVFFFFFFFSIGVWQAQTGSLQALMAGGENTCNVGDDHLEDSKDEWSDPPAYLADTPSSIASQAITRSIALDDCCRGTGPPKAFPQEQAAA